MRVPTDMPKRRRSSGRGRIIVIVVVAVAFLLITSLRGLAGFWTDYLWFDSLGLSSVFSGVLGAKIALGIIFTGVFFVLTFASLTVADRIAPKNRHARPRGRPAQPLPRGRRPPGHVCSGPSCRSCSASSPASGMSSEWNQWILFRNGGSFGDQRPDVPDRRRLLRLQAAVLHHHRELAVRLAASSSCSSRSSPTTSTAASGCSPRSSGSPRR